MHSPFDYRRKTRLARASDLYRFLTEGKSGLGQKLINHVLVTMNHMSNDPEHGGLNQHSIDALAASLEQIAARGLEVQAAVQRVSTTDGCYQASEPMQLTDTGAGKAVPEEIVIDESVLCELRNLWRENIDIDRYMAICLDALHRGLKVTVVHGFGPPRIALDGNLVQLGPFEQQSFIHHIAAVGPDYYNEHLWSHHENDPDAQEPPSFHQRPPVMLQGCSREETNRMKLDLLLELVQDLQAARQRAEVKNHINVNMDFSLRDQNDATKGKPLFDRGWVVIMLPEERAKRLTHSAFLAHQEPILLVAMPPMDRNGLQWANAPVAHDSWTHAQIWSERECAEAVALNDQNLKMAASMGMTMLVRRLRSVNKQKWVSLEVGA